MSDLKFTRKTMPETDFVSFLGRPKDKMPELIESGFKFGNYRELCTSRNPKHNSDENDRTLLFNNYFTLPGNPVIGNPSGNDEQTIIVDLDHKSVAEIKALVASLNKDTELNDTRALEVPQEMYDAIRRIPGVTHTLKPSLVKSLREDAYSSPSARQAIVEAFFQGKLTEAKEYIGLVKKHHNKKNINAVLGFYPGNFTGMRLVWAGSVGYNNAYAYSLNDLYGDNGRLFGVGARGAGAPMATDNRQVLSLDELEVVKAYRSHASTIPAHNGVYIFSDKVSIK